MLSGMPKTPLPFDPSLPENDPRQRHRLIVRAARIRRAAGEPLTRMGRLPRQSYADAVFVISKHDALAAMARQERAAARQARAAARVKARGIPRVVLGLRRLHGVPLLPVIPRPNAALAQRRRRLLALAPPGATPEVWAEIVDHFACLCAFCGKPASRASWLPSGDPVPVCAAHGVHIQAPADFATRGAP
jgi:hypothetical protein